MADEKYTFSQARVRLEEIVVQVRKKDISLEQSIELLEEGVRLANQCTELSDHTEWQTVVEEQQSVQVDDGGQSDEASASTGDEPTQPVNSLEPDDDRDGVVAQSTDAEAGE